MKNIVVAIDFSEFTSKLLDVAKDMASSQDARLWLIHVAAPDPDFVGYEVGPQSVRDQRAKVLREEHRQIQAFAKTLTEAGIETQGLLIQGPTVKSLLEEAEDLKADLIIIGSHGHGFLYEKLIGSICSEVFHQSKVPVLMVPVKG